MTGPEAGFALLCCGLGTGRKPLTTLQFKTLSRRVYVSQREEVGGQVELGTLKRLGYSDAMAQRIVELLGEDALLRRYEDRAMEHGIALVTRISVDYPERLLQVLGQNAPPMLCMKGELTLLHTPCVALVGNRDLDLEGVEFAKAAGKACAQQGFTLVSGGARGADHIAQEACLKAGGSVICFVADGLLDKRPNGNLLYISESDFDRPFSPERALSRNRLIHALGSRVLVARASRRRGGTWKGVSENLKNDYSPVFLRDDGSPASQALMAMGANAVTIGELGDLVNLFPGQISLF